MRKPAKPCNSNEKARQTWGWRRGSWPGTWAEQRPSRTAAAAGSEGTGCPSRRTPGKRISSYAGVHYEKTCIQEKKHLSQLCHGASVNNLPKKGSLPNQKYWYLKFFHVFKFFPISPSFSDCFKSHFFPFLLYGIDETVRATNSLPEGLYLQGKEPFLLPWHQRWEKWRCRA